MWKYRTFRAAIVDAIFASILLIPTWFLKPAFVQQVAVFVGIWQPVFILWIVGPEVSQLVEQHHELKRLAILQAQADIQFDLLGIENRKKENAAHAIADQKDAIGYSSVDVDDDLTEINPTYGWASTGGLRARLP